MRGRPDRGSSNMCKKHRLAMYQKAVTMSYILKSYQRSRNTSDCRTCPVLFRHVRIFSHLLDLCPVDLLGNRLTVDKGGNRLADGRNMGDLDHKL